MGGQMRTKDELADKYRDSLEEATKLGLTDDKEAICIIALAMPLFVEILIDIRDELARLNKTT